MTTCNWIARLEPSDWAGLLTGVGTVLLAIYAIIQNGKIKKQIAVSEKSADAAAIQADTSRELAVAAAESARSAAEVNKEAIRARVDQYAPRVVVHYEIPDGPFLDSSRSRMPGGGELPLLDTPPEHLSDPAGRQFSFPADAQTLLWFKGRALLINEGNSTARVRLPQQSRFVTGSDPLTGEDVELPIEVYDLPATSGILPPGGRALFEWAAGNTVEEWSKKRAELGKNQYESEIWFWLLVRDDNEFGVADTLLARFAPDAVMPAPGRDGVWTLGDPQHFGSVGKYPTRRNYVHEGHETEDVSKMYEHFGLDRFGRPIVSDSQSTAN